MKLNKKGWAIVFTNLGVLCYGASELLTTAPEDEGQGLGLFVSVAFAAVSAIIAAIKGTRKGDPA